MKNILLIFVLTVILCVVSAAVGVFVGEQRAARRSVLWYNGPSGFTPARGVVFQVGGKNYELGVRSDGVVIVREGADPNQTPHQVSAKTSNAGR